MSVRRPAVVALLMVLSLGLQGCLAAAAVGTVVGVTGAVVGGAGKAAVGVGKAVIPGESREDRERREDKDRRRQRDADRR